MRNFLATAGQIVSLLCILCLSQGHARGDDRGQVDRVFKVWKGRQDRTQGVRFAWTQASTFPKGSLQGYTKTGDNPPLEDTVANQSCTMILKKDWARYEKSGAQYNPTQEKFSENQYASSCFNETAKTFFANPFSGGYPFGEVKKANNDPNVQSYELRPILLHYRPMHPSMGAPGGGFRVGTWTCGNREMVLHDRSCIVLENSGVAIKQRYWIDPERDCSILRVEYLHKDDALLKIDIDYRNDPSWGWVPSGWDASLLNEGKLREGATAKVSSYEINPQIDDGAIDFSFPPGTWVRDARDKTTYLTREGGTKRLITKVELSRGVSYDELMRTESGSAGLRGNRSQFVVLSIGAFLAIVAIACFRHVARAKD